MNPKLAFFLKKALFAALRAALWSLVHADPKAPRRDRTGDGPETDPPTPRN